jgi:hypothetical protein
LRLDERESVAEVRGYCYAPQEQHVTAAMFQKAPVEVEVDSF